MGGVNGILKGLCPGAKLGKGKDEKLKGKKGGKKK